MDRIPGSRNQVGHAARTLVRAQRVGLFVGAGCTGVGVAGPVDPLTALVLVIVAAFVATVVASMWSAPRLLVALARTELAERGGVRVTWMRRDAADWILTVVVPVGDLVELARQARSVTGRSASVLIRPETGRTELRLGPARSLHVVTDNFDAPFRHRGG